MDKDNYEDATWKDVFKALGTLAMMVWAVVLRKSKKALTRCFSILADVLQRTGRAILWCYRKMVRGISVSAKWMYCHPWSIMLVMGAVIAWQGLRIMQDAVERNNDSLKIYQLSEQVDRLEMKYYRYSR